MAEEKKILIDLGNVRIMEYDAMNVKIERLEEVRNPVTKEINTKWTFKGYSRTILTALESIQKNELLINKNVISGFETYLNEVINSNKKLIDAISSANSSVEGI